MDRVDAFVLKHIRQKRGDRRITERRVLNSGMAGVPGLDRRKNERRSGRDRRRIR